MKETTEKALQVTGKVLRTGIGLGLLLLNGAATAVGAILYAVTSQD